LSARFRQIALAAFIPALVSAALACGKAAPPPPPPDRGLPKVVILGFDGVDPRFLSRFMAAGKLPNLARLAKGGTYRPLVSTNPPQSPVAWSTFATGLGPGKHGIYDFVKRDPATYLPAVATSSVSPPEMRFGLFVKAPPAGHNPRRGESFWKKASDAGVRVTVLNVPYAFPPDDVEKTGRQLSGLGTPDLLGTNSTFFYYATDLTEKELAKSVGGGRLLKVAIEGNVANATLEGPPNPKDEEGKPLTLPLRFRLDAAAKKVSVRVGGADAEAREGGWTPWMEIAFRVSPFYTIRGICRFYILQAGPALRIYGSPLNYHPEHPFVPFTSPERFSADLARAVGLYKTVGWDHDTSGLNAERMDEAAFLSDVAMVEDQREKMLLRALDARDWDLLVAVSTATDRVSHMFYRLLDPTHPRYDAKLAARYGDAIEKTSVRMDRVVGEVLRKLPKGTTLILLSDHGFHDFRRGLHTNSWLVRNGFMTLQPSDESPDGRFSTKDFFPAVDWSKTKAYALGTGQVYLNLEGRERDGIVKPEEADRVAAEIAAKMEAFTDPKTGEKPLRKVYLGKQVFPGARPEEMPDLQLAFRDGWRTSWETMLGAAPDALTATNDKKWSGDHAASDVADTDGVLLVNRRLPLDKPRIVDLAATILKTYQIGPPQDGDGVALW